MVVMDVASQQKEPVLVVLLPLAPKRPRRREAAVPSDVSSAVRIQAVALASLERRG
jgi:hypothetical protein